MNRFLNGGVDIIPIVKVVFTTDEIMHGGHHGRWRFNRMRRNKITGSDALHGHHGGRGGSFGVPYGLIRDGVRDQRPQVEREGYFFKLHFFEFEPCAFSLQHA